MSNKSSTPKILLITGVIIISLIGLGIYLVAHYADPWASRKIIEELNKLENGPLKLKYDTIQVNLATGHFDITNVSMVNTSGNIAYEISFDKLDMDGMGFVHYLLNDQITIKRVHFSSPHLKLIKTSHIDSVEITSTAYSFPQVLIKHISLDDGSFEISNGDSISTHLLTSGKFEMKIDRLETDSTKVYPFSPIGMDNLRLSLSDILVNVPDSITLIKLQSARVDMKKQFIEIDSVWLSSKYSKFKLGPHVGHEVDWMDLMNASIKIKGFDFNKVAIDSIYHADCVSVDGLRALIFRDKRLPFPNKPDSKLLHQVMADLNIKVDIDTIKLTRSHIEYQEFVKKAVGPGRVRFENLYASFYNFTNVDTVLQSIDYRAHMDAQCNLMGKGLLKASFTFPLTAKYQTSTVSGSLSEMELNALNPMLEYVGFTRIKQGRLLDLSFDLNYNENNSEGRMNFVYENLKINTLDKESNTSEGLGENIKSFLANTFIVRTNNTRDTGKFRVGSISFARDKKKSIFNYWWKSLLTGFRSSTGIEAPEERIDNN